MRLAGDRMAETAVNKKIRASSKADKTKWLEGAVASGHWNDIQQVYRQRAPNQGRLKSTSGRIVESSTRADTFAEYLSTIQWATTSAPCSPRATLLA